MKIGPEKPRTPSKILTIRIVLPCYLLRLPRELRDLVYEYTLIEPQMRNRRHVVGCPFYGLAVWEEKLPWRILEEEQYYPGELDHKHRTTSSSIDICLDICLTRRGLGLLRVNKQVHAEASLVFWRRNTFCFEHFKDFTETFSAISRFSPHILRNIQSLSLIKAPCPPRIRPWSLILRRILFEESRQVRRIFDEMRNLVHLELSLEWAYILASRNVGFRNLRYLDCLAMKRLSYSSTGTDEVRTVDVALKTGIRVPRCEGRWGCKNEPEEIFCRACSALFSRTEEKFTALDTALSYNRQLWEEEVQRKLELKDPSAAAHEPYTLQLKMRNGTMKEVSVWGLPSPASKDLNLLKGYQRRKAARKAASDAYQALQETIAKQRMLTPRMMIDEEEGEVRIPHLRGKKNWQRLEEQRNRGREFLMQQKEEARKAEKRHERANKKSEKQEAVKEKKKAVAETQAERKAARKRSGRR